MHKRFSVFLMAALVAALAAKFAYARSIDPQPLAPVPVRSMNASPPAAVVVAPVLLRRAVTPATVVHPQLDPVRPDAGKLLLIGTALFGLSALVRKAI